MKTFIIISLLFAIVHAQQQNLCGERTRNPQFVNDYSGCRAYLFCNFDAMNTLVSVHQLVCPENTVFNEELSACDGTGGTVCNPAAPCPPGRNLMIAEPTDPNCRRFSLCSNGILLPNVGTCPVGTVFNRNYGTCTTEAVAPCLGFSESPCEPFSNGFYRVFGSCTEHAFCQNGIEISRHNCPAGQHFNPATRSCDSPENVVPPCPWA
ncbi:hypothetical protein PVAND_009755 [Polypedilum vanderplanki]|uniref:Chitin-binding type-2 domain-containing protein n=1 Tax=Polypedilum vanderplanki TaxID=319348 RepID=A0A9J6CEI7_POLVA|nr:hypothetical protein PVAND_009755 [Polypedilum vanderplanki]